MSAADWVRDPDAARAKAEEMRVEARKLRVNDPLRPKMLAIADHVEGVADQLDELSPEMRDDLIEMLAGLTRH